MTIWAFDDLLDGRAPDIASAVEILVGRAHRGNGLSHRMLAALRDAARDAGLTRLVAPVRPNGKHRYPDLPMALVPVRCDADRDHAVYMDPNVWLEHVLSDAGS